MPNSLAIEFYEFIGAGKENLNQERQGFSAITAIVAGIQKVEECITQYGAW